MKQTNGVSTGQTISDRGETTVRTLSQGMVNVFLLEGDGLVLVDAGLRGGEKRLLRTIRENGVDPKQIRLIVATHNHEDHIGALQAMRDATGARTAMSVIDCDVMEGRMKDEITPLSLLAKIMFRLAGVDGKPEGDTKPHVKPPQKNHTPAIDIAFNGTFDLRPFGIAGDVLPTPGHTKGSVSILLEDGSALIGDNLMAMMPWSKPGRPMLAHDLDMIRKSLRMLLDRGAVRFYLSHGKSFGREAVEQALRKL